MLVSHIVLMLSFFAIVLGGIGFLKTTVREKSRQRESEWLHGISKNQNLTEDEIMRPARIRDDFHEAYRKMIIWGLYGLVIGLMAKLVEGMLGL